MTRRLVLPLACAALVIPASAAGHTPIKSLTPSAGGSANRSLGSVRVAFAGRISDANLTVRSASGRKVSRGSGTLYDGRKRVRVRLVGGLSRGSYRATVKWLSSDGHILQRSWSFRLR
jgi:methionine-rich copper-binding protein CopC